MCQRRRSRYYGWAVNPSEPFTLPFSDCNPGYSECNRESTRFADTFVVVESVVVALVEHLAFEGFPKTLKEVEVWCTGWRKQDVDPGILQIFGDCLGARVVCVAADNCDALGNVKKWEGGGQLAPPTPTSCRYQ